MRLIDADILHKEFEEQIRDFVTEADKECFRYAEQIVDKVSTAKAIPIKWMWETFYELMYDGEKLTDKDKTILSKLIDRWEKNESHTCD